MWQTLHNAWWRLATQSHPQSFSDALASSVLQAGSAAYRAAIALRNAAYDRGWVRSVRLPCRVVSVGNLTVGGTGKTACTELIAKKLTAVSRRVAVLSRGYGGMRSDYWLRWEHNQMTLNGQEIGPHPAGDLADEAQLLARRLSGIPILVGARRDRTGRRAIEEFGCDTVILDDGFQHRCLARDCDIVLLSARMPLGGWAALPRGPMREPITSLRRTDIVMITKVEDAFERIGALRDCIHAVNPTAVIVTAMHEPTRLVDQSTGTSRAPTSLSGARVGLVSSIGDPEGFETTVQRLHATIVWHLRFPDHHGYDPGDLDAIQRQARRMEVNVILTTEKDWMRFVFIDKHPALLDLPWSVLEVRLRLVDEEEQFDDRLARLYAR